MTDVGKVVRDVGYTALGFAVIGFQRAQVRRRELERDLKRLLAKTCTPPSARER